MAVEGVWTSRRLVAGDREAIRTLVQSVIPELIADFGEIAFEGFRDGDVSKARAWLDSILAAPARWYLWGSFDTATMTLRGAALEEVTDPTHMTVWLIATDKTLPRGNPAQRSMTTLTRINAFRALQHDLGNNLPLNMTGGGRVKAGGTLDLLLQAVVPGVVRTDNGDGTVTLTITIAQGRAL